ncbi:MAG: MBL fold metallo-hydrolase [Elusimicrobia bacterium]|nr:MBL fold metallo-hydrolase [Elusimicrobiota bacterium]
MKRIAEGIYALEACGFVNAYLLEGANDLTLVDAGPAKTADALVEELADNGFRLKDVQRAIVTHAHADHCGALSLLLAKHRFKVYAHPKDIPALTGKTAAKGFRGLKGFCLGFYHEQFLPWEPLEVALPVETGQPVRGLPQWQMIHMPGHTDGSLGLFHPGKQILICGDALSNRCNSLHLPESSYLTDPEAARRTLGELAKIDCDILCCGHGPLLRGGAFRFIGKLL